MDKQYHTNGQEAKMNVIVVGTVVGGYWIGNGRRGRSWRTLYEVTRLTKSYADAKPIPCFKDDAPTHEYTDRGRSEIRFDLQSMRIWKSKDEVQVVNAEAQRTENTEALLAQIALTQEAQLNGQIQKAMDARRQMKSYDAVNVAEVLVDMPGTEFQQLHVTVNNIEVVYMVRVYQKSDWLTNAQKWAVDYTGMKRYQREPAWQEWSRDSGSLEGANTREEVLQAIVIRELRVELTDAEVAEVKSQF